MPNRESKLLHRVPDAYLILFMVVLVAAALTYLIPAGTFGMKTLERNGVAQTVIDPDQFQIATDDEGNPLHVNVSLFTGEADMGARLIHRFPSNANGKTGVFNFAYEGMTSGSKYSAAVGVIAFILIIGGSFGIILRTGAIDRGIFWVIRKSGKKGIVIIPVLFVLFSLGGAIFGMSEETIAFAMLVVPLIIALGYDSITAVFITYVATQVGFATSWMNPFNIGVAQGLADIPLLSGSRFRFIMWISFTIIGTAYALLYAVKIHRKPKASRVYQSDEHFRLQKTEKEQATDSFSIGHALVVIWFLLGLIWIILGVVHYHYYIPEIATQFLIIGILSGCTGAIFKLNGMSWNDIPGNFRKGASDLLGAAMMVGMAKGIIILLGGDNPAQPSVLNTILHWTGSTIEPFPPVFAAEAMLVFQSGLNFLIPSGSGQAALTIPLMAPLADIAGLSRQIAVLAFQLGDGLTNIIIPTSASLIGTLAVARIDFVCWVRFIWKFQLLLSVLAALCIAIAVSIGYK